MVLVGVELEALVSQPDALTTRPPGVRLFILSLKQYLEEQKALNTQREYF